MTVRVAMYFLGGTISMSATDEHGAVPTLGADELIAAIPALAELDVELTGETIAREQSGSITFEHLMTVFDKASNNTDADGFVLVQGTDTLEESAYFIDLLWGDDRPFLVTGAMRHAGAPGADGDANILAAVIAASSEQLHGLGAVVAFADELHAARFVRKSDTTSLTTFTSPNAGPIGRVLEGYAHVFLRPERFPPIWAPEKVEYECPILHVSLGQSEKAFRLLADNSDALVIAGLGAGHIPGWWAPFINDYIDTMPIIMTSRTHSGPALTKTYGAVGAEIDLFERGTISGGYLTPEKVRLILMLVMSRQDRLEAEGAILARGHFHHPLR